MKQIQRLLLFYALLALLLVDAWIVMEALLSPRRESVDAWKLLLAAIVQMLAVGVCVLYAVYLSRPKPAQTRPNVVLGVLQLRFVPVLVACLMAAVSFVLLEQAMKCGSQPFPSNRGTPICGKP